METVCDTMIVKFEQMSSQYDLNQLGDNLIEIEPPSA